MTSTKQQAAVLLEAVARHCEDALDPEVPILCGHAAGLLGGSRQPMPALADEQAEMIAAISSAIAHLSTIDVTSLDEAEIDRITDAAAEALAALVAAQR